MKRRLLFIATVLGIFIAAVLLWRYTPLAQFASPERLTEWIGTFRAQPWSPAALIAVFILSGLVVFPVTLLIAATAVVFSPPAALAIAFTGTLANAALLYVIGARWVRGSLHELFGPFLRRVNNALETRGVVAVMVLRIVPVAPFAIMNVAMGSIGVRFRDYLLGTALGVAPGVILITAFGNRLKSMWENPTARNIATLAGVIAGWIVLSLVLQWAVSRRQRRPPVPQAFPD